MDFHYTWSKPTSLPDPTGPRLLPLAQTFLTSPQPLALFLILRSVSGALHILLLPPPTWALPKILKGCLLSISSNATSSEKPSPTTPVKSYATTSLYSLDHTILYLHCLTSQLNFLPTCLSPPELQYKPHYSC